MRLLLTILFVLLSISSYSQKRSDIGVELGPEVLEVGEVFNIKITVRKSPNSNVNDFPEIEGLRKDGKFVSHAKIKINDKNVLQHIITQNYKAIEWGTFELPEFVFLVNGEKILLPKGKITISNKNDFEEADFIDTLSNEHALLFLFVNKQKIVVGEGFRLNLAFYVSEENTVLWEFPENMASQIESMVTRLKPENCLESRRKIGVISPEPALINGKKYIRYKFYEGMYYPLGSQDISLPSVTLNMDLIKMLADSTQETKVRPFSSRPFLINVAELSDHPLKNKVAVGNFRLKEISKIGVAKTGKILNYGLAIEGEGNIKTLLFDKPGNTKKFDFYPPQTFDKQIDGAEMGERTFTFKVFPKDSGYYNFGDYFQWIYFNTVKKDYDTLRAKQSLLVSGPTIETYSANSRGVYDNLEKLSVSDKSINYRKIVKIGSNILLFLMLGGMLFIFDFKKKKRH
ncbi:MAG: hypothetical protein ACI8UX_000875 [Psychromonas sp.]|jgi:hypothetical protein